MVSEQIIRELTEVVGPAYVHTDPVDLQCYAFDATFEEWRPDIVVRPATTAEVAGVLTICNRARLPVIARGMGSGLAGGTVPAQFGGLVLSLTRMDHILEIDEQNMTATVEAGVITADLQTAVEARGLFYPPDPSSIKHSTLGGNVACNAGGPRCLKYGVTKDYVMGVKAVLADGRILAAGGKPIKYVTGYDLPALLIGSEGTLAVITEVLLRLIARPTVTMTGMAVFHDLDQASQAVNKVLQAGFLPATLEIMDDTTIHTVEEYLHLGLPLDAAAILIFESDGRDRTVVQAELDGMAGLFRSAGASEVRVAQSEEERNALWRGRRSVSPSLARRRPNKLGEDISLPRSAIPEAVRRIKAIGRQYGLPIAIFGHAGDGNLHPNIMFDRRDAEEWARVQKASAAIFAVALELGGTLTGEHGVGLLKRPYLEGDVGATAVDVMRAIKRALDPNGILNPGKIFVH
jgi:glycolate oxidase